MIKCLLFIILFSWLEATQVTIIGKIKRADGLGRQTLEILELYKDHFPVNCIATRLPDFNEVSKEVQSLIHYQKNTPLGNVVIFEECLWFPEGRQHHQLVATPKRPDQIRIAYSMFDATEIPAEFTNIINNYFDAVVVPDKFLVEIYQQGGVEVPIFELPLGLDIQHLLNSPLKQEKKSPFVFSFLGSCVKRKNQITLVRAFNKAFQGQSDVKLYMNSRYQDRPCYFELMKEIKILKNPNIIFQTRALDTPSYTNALLNTDCLINISKGEGYSIQPREAMALGIPTILTNNTAQTTLCESGLIRAVPSLIREKAYSAIMRNTVGEDFNCEVDDVAEAMRDVYENYDSYLSQSEERRQFAAQYDFSNLKNRYLNMVSPTVLKLGEVNEITEEGLTTTSIELYTKYKFIK